MGVVTDIFIRNFFPKLGPLKLWHNKIYIYDTVISKTKMLTMFFPCEGEFFCKHSKGYSSIKELEGAQKFCSKQFATGSSIV
jgi:hypothetical protein